METPGLGIISPRDWGLAPVASERLSAEPVPGLGMSFRELERRARANTMHWLATQWDAGAGAFSGHYDAPHRRREPPNTVNLIAPWQLMASWDREGDAAHLERARRAAEWFTRSYVVGHPMSVVVGGVRDTGRRHELWTKYAAEHVILCLGLARRTGAEALFERALQSAQFLRQSRRHGFAPRYDERAGEWLARGWQSFGRGVEAMLDLEQYTGDRMWLDEAVAWGRLGLDLIQPDGGLYLLDGEYYNSDIAADEIRAFCFLHERTGEADYLRAARQSGVWHLEHRDPSGSWPVNIDREGVAIARIAGPGDMSNLAIAFLRLASLDPGDSAWMDAALSAVGYAYRLQATPGSGHPYLGDRRVRWGFWSWDPYYDYTLSADQSTHHVRAAYFLIDSYGRGRPG